MCSFKHFRDRMNAEISIVREFAFTLVALFFVMHLPFALAAEDPNPISDPGHFDAIVTVAPAAGNGARIEIDKAGVFPRDYAAQRVLIPANFGDFSGGPYKTDDPGWVVHAGDLLAGEVLQYRALGNLLFWDSAQQNWTTVMPRGETVRLFGEVPTDILLRNDPTELAFYRQGTIWNANGVAGPLEAAIQVADTSGAVHAHLDFCVQDSGGDCSIPGLGYSGTPTVGAYLIELQIFSSAMNNGRAKYRSSNPLFIVLNRGLSQSEFRAAVEARTKAPANLRRQIPASGILIIGQR